MKKREKIELIVKTMDDAAREKFPTVTNDVLRKAHSHGYRKYWTTPKEREENGNEI